MSDRKNIPEFHGNPNDLVWNPAYVFNLKDQLAAKDKELLIEVKRNATLILGSGELKEENALLFEVVERANDYVRNSYPPECKGDLMRFNTLKESLEEKK